MRAILANYSASISELKRSPTDILNKVGNSQAVAIMNHNTPKAYLVPSELYEKLMEFVDDYVLAKEVEKVLDADEKPVKVSLDELI
ncbi:MAG: type II toxin-antitoxin system prevent-host-death family antitoxin [Campylobacter sp.]|nr:type II toxin-antitoxin system prevent-host-death family antitoxin [Campylobacter sp.]